MAGVHRTSSGERVDKRALTDEVARLTEERGHLFARAHSNLGYTASEQEQLAAIDRALDECYIALRDTRADKAVTFDEARIWYPELRSAGRTEPGNS